MTTDRATIHGHGTAVLTGPNGEIKAEVKFTNLVTQVGDQWYGDRAAEIGSIADVTGMKLGTGSTAPSKTGAGSHLGATYLANSHQAIEAGFPASSLSGSARRISWQAIWAAGKATSASPITEVVIVNDVLADATSTAANTISRALIAGIAAKGADDTLTINWHHDIGG